MTILFLATVWCFGYGVQSLLWALGAPGFPFGADDPRGREMGSLLASADPVPTGLAFAVGCALAGAVTLYARRHPSRPAGVALLISAFAVLAVVPDVRLLQNLAYSLGGNVDLVDRPVLNQALCVLGAGLLARSGYRLVRSPADADPRTAARWLRIGRWATLVAILASLPYAAQRAAWNLGVPVGVSEQFVHDLADDIAAKGLSPIVAWSLVLPDVVGALLTLGLVMKWGERFPSWVPGLGGRRVPISLAVIPASLVSVAVTIAGLTVLRFAIQSGHVTGSAAPGLLWIPWGISLGVATFAYAERRRASRASAEAPAQQPSAA